MLNLLDGPPCLGRRAFDRPKLRLGVAVRDNAEPVAIAVVLGDTVFVLRHDHRPVRRADALDLDQAQLTRVRIQAGQIVAKILLVYVGDRSALGSLVLHRDHTAISSVCRLGIKPLG